MFTVKATYRGETRKLSFPYTTSFPTYDELCSQLYRVFPINNDYYLTRLLYSPNASNPARILVSSEIHSQEQYDTAVKPYNGRVYPTALLRFSVFDDTPHKQPSQRSSMNMDAFHNLESAYGFADPGRSVNINSDDKRPALPPKPAELFSTPFEYISSLSGRSHGSSVSRTSSIRSTSTPMDIDPRPLPQPRGGATMGPTNLSTSSTTSCCSMAEVKEEIKVLIDDFQKDVNKALEKGFGSSAAPQVSVSLSHSEGAAQDKQQSVNLSSLFAEGSFPATGPARRGSVRSGCTRNASTRSRRIVSQASGCLNSASAQPSGRPLPQVPEQVVHTNVVCDSCENTIVGVRHKCLDCRDFDLCTACIKNSAAEKHNPFHEFIDIQEPGRVIVHTVFDNERQARPTPPATTASGETSVPPQPIQHNATCDLCESSITGIRYKCCSCPDFDTCESCFKITPEQHPRHSFFRMEKDAIVRRSQSARKAHYARCDSCQKTIYGVRYKCMHPECPDFDLCDRCEAMPIPVHPDTHPLLKMRNPEVVVPTVYRVGGTELIPEPAPEPYHQPPLGWDYRPAYAPRDGYNPSYLKGRTCMSVPISTGGAVSAQEDQSHEDDRAPTPRPKEKVLEGDADDLRDPFADPAPVITPIDVAGSMLSSFTAPVEDRMNGVRDGSPLSAALDREKTLFEGFLDRPKSTEAESQKQALVEEKKEHAPSFVNDVLEDFFKSVGKPYRRRDEPLAKEVEMTEKEDDSEETLSSIVSGVRNLVAIVNGETPIAQPTVPQELEKVEEAQEKEQISPAIPTNPAPEASPQAEVPKELPAPSTTSTEAKEVAKEDAPAPVTVLSAGFIADVTVPDGQVFPPGAEFMKCWKMVNDGDVDWPESTEVVFVAGQPGLVTRGNEVVKVGVVKVGEQADVWTGELKAPEGIGRFVGYWRLRNGDTKEVFGNSIWVEIEVAEADHMSDEAGSMSGSSIVMMPTVLGGGATTSSATSLRPESLTLTIPSSSSTTTDGESDLGSEGSLIDYMSDGEVVGWEDARSRQEAASEAEAVTAPAPGSPLGDEFELVYDSSSDM